MIGTEAGLNQSNFSPESATNQRFTMKIPKEKINVERKKFERKRRSYNMSKITFEISVLDQY